MISGTATSSDLAATTDLNRARGMGIVYRPGLRPGDTCSLTHQSGTGLAVDNASGWPGWGWGL